MKAVILAAGNGLRLAGHGTRPKPLYSVAGLPLILRVILSAREAGINDFVIVINPNGSEIEQTVARGVPDDVRVSFVVNHDWERGNGTSLLAAAPQLDAHFVVLMADHIFEPDTLKRFLARPLDADQSQLAVDLKIGAIFDLPDATKVVLEEKRILQLGKHLPTNLTSGERQGLSRGRSELAAEQSPLDLSEPSGFASGERTVGIDTGMFLCSTKIFSYLRESSAAGRGGLSDAMNLAAAHHNLLAFDIGDAFWQDVDTREARQHARRWYWKKVIKPTDGIISRYFNRKISGLISRVALWIGMTANQMTFVTLGLGIVASLLAASGDRFSLAWGGFLFMLSSIVDGCDGEVATLTYTKSKRGEWLDTICDNLTYVFFITGISYGVLTRTSESLQMTHLAILAGCALYGLLAALGVMYYYLLRYTGSGSLVTVYKDVGEDLKTSGAHRGLRILAKLRFMVKRDFFAVLFMVLCLMNRPVWILLLTAIGTNVIWAAVLVMKRQFGFARAIVKE